MSKVFSNINFTRSPKRNYFERLHSVCCQTTTDNKPSAQLFITVHLVSDLANSNKQLPCYKTTWCYLVQDQHSWGMAGNCALNGIMVAIKTNDESLTNVNIEPMTQTLRYRGCCRNELKCASSQHKMIFHPPYNMCPPTIKRVSTHHKTSVHPP